MHGLLRSITHYLMRPINININVNVTHFWFFTHLFTQHICFCNPTRTTVSLVISILHSILSSLVHRNANADTNDSQPLAHLLADCITPLTDCIVIKTLHCIFVIAAICLLHPVTHPITNFTIR